MYIEIMEKKKEVKEWLFRGRNRKGLTVSHDTVAGALGNMKIVGPSSQVSHVERHVELIGCEKERDG